MRGIDVSVYQGNIDWEKVRNAGVEFAIIRAGYDNSSDSFFEINLQAAKSAGIYRGAYWFSNAVNIGMAEREAELLIEHIGSAKLEFPLFIDFESASVENSEIINPSLICELVLAFLSILKNKNFYGGLYTNYSFYQKMFSDCELDAALWIAKWNGSRPFLGEQLWQYSNEGRINGIDGYVSLDYSFVDFPSVISQGGFNGFERSDSEVVESGYININGKNYPVNRILKDGENYIRLRDFMQAGFDVGYNPETKIPSFGVRADDITIEINGKEVSVKRILKFNENYIRLRSLENFINIEYNPTENKISIII